jgi:hypothetical protein
MAKYVLLMEERHGTLVQIAKRRIRKNDYIQYKGRSYLVDTSAPHHVKKRDTYYMIDIHNGQLTSSGTCKTVSSELIDEILSKQIARQLVGSMGANMMTAQLLPIIIGIAIGLPIGVIAGGYIQ